MSVGIRRAMTLAIGVVAVAAVACTGEGSHGESDNQISSPANIGASATPTRTPTPTPEPTEVPFHSQISVAPDFTLPSANGSPVTLSELAAEKPVVLVFYRAFW